jgi:hypothetical protein
MDDLPLPPALQGIFFAFRWDKRTLWALSTASSLVEISELAWHLELPVWSTRPPAALFDLSPAEVISNRQHHPDHWQRIAQADVRYPLEMFAHNGRWVIMDGYHRLAQLAANRIQQVSVRKHPHEYLAQIRVSA